jgi:hypothetical protein
MLDKETQKLFEEMGVDEIEEADVEPMYKSIWRSRWWWYNWFSRAVRRHTNFWGSEANTYGVKTHNISYNTRISGAVNRVCAKWNCPSDSPLGRRNQKLGTNERIHKINRYNKYYVNKRLSVFNPKQ